MPTLRRLNSLSGEQCNLFFSQEFFGVRVLVLRKQEVLKPFSCPVLIKNESVTGLLSWRLFQFRVTNVKLLNTAMFMYAVGEIKN